MIKKYLGIFFDPSNRYYMSRLLRFKSNFISDFSGRGSNLRFSINTSKDSEYFSVRRHDRRSAYLVLNRRLDHKKTAQVDFQVKEYEIAGRFTSTHVARIIIFVTPSYVLQLLTALISLLFYNDGSFTAFTLFDKFHYLLDISSKLQNATSVFQQPIHLKLNLNS